MKHVKKQLVLCLCLFCVACDGLEYKLPRVAQHETILAFGDSLTFGKGAARGEDYPTVLSSLIGRSVINAGVSGETTIQGLTRLPGALSQYRPRLMILCLGGNDFIRRVSRETTKDNLRKMINLAKTQNISVLLIEVPNLGLLGFSPSPIYAELSDELKVPLFKETLPELLSDSKYKSDSIHLSAAGYRRWAEELANYLKEAGVV